MAYLTPSASAADGVLTNPSGTTMRLTKSGAGITSALAGEYLTLWGCPSAANDGHWLITAADTDYVEFTNASGVEESIDDWEIVDQDVANDWIIAGSIGSIIEAKSAHTLSPLDTNQLDVTKYSDFTRSFGGTAVAVQYQAHPRHTAFIDDPNAQAMSLLFRPQGGGWDESLALWPFIILRQQSASIWFSLYYRPAFSLYLDANKVVGGNDWVTTVRTGTPAVQAAAHTVPSIGAWSGMRLQLTTEGTDVRFKGYYTHDLNILNGLGGSPWVDNEPDWPLVMEGRFVNGNAVPQDVTTGTQHGGWGSSTPSLQGTPSFNIHARAAATGTMYLERPYPARI